MSDLTKLYMPTKVYYLLNVHNHIKYSIRDKVLMIIFIMLQYHIAHFLGN